MQQNRSTAVILICIYEVIIGLYGLISQAFATLSMYLLAHRYHYGAVSSIIGIVQALIFAALSFCIAIFVFSRLRTAFVLSLIKLVLGIFSTVSLFYVMFKHGMLSNPYLLHSPAFLVSFWLPRAIGIVSLLISVAVTIYLSRAAYKRGPATPAQWYEPSQG